MKQNLNLASTESKDMTAEDNKKAQEEAFRQEALDYHRNNGRPGKVAINPTTPLATQHDLALAYSPGVAVPCEEIAADPLKAYDYTAKGNTVAVISNGTAVLGLGNIGAQASKPVMEGKSVLFKKFANIDSVDVEIDVATDTQEGIDKFVDIVCSLEPTYGGINLEDIKAPECFEIERRIRERMNIPVFHDDQHGTAIIVTAAVRNWLEFSGRKAEDIKLVASGAGAAAIACLNLLLGLGIKLENIIVCDRKGVVYKGRTESMDPQKEKFANDTEHRDLKSAIAGADIFLGLSGPGVLDHDQVASMADAPLILALANPTPEIMPADALAAKPNAIVCTGRSDFPNQVNNVLCFPFLFRGALDVGATTINEDMKLACVEAIASLARKEAHAELSKVYAGEKLAFGPDYLIPKPFDPRLIVDLPIAIAKKAIESGVATRPIEDWDAYAQKLQQLFERSNLVMRPIITRAKEAPKRVVFCEAEEEQVLQGVQTAVDEGTAMPILIGRQSVLENRIEKLGLRLKQGENFTLVDPESDERYRDYWESYYDIMGRKGISAAAARTVVRTNSTVIGALMVRKGDADAVVCGTTGSYADHLRQIEDIIGLKDGVKKAAALNPVILSRGTYFFCDTQVNPNPTAEDLVEMTLLAAEEVRRFGITPKIAMLSHSNFGNAPSESATKMRQAYEEIRRRAPDLQIEGEMQADTALSREIRDNFVPNSSLSGSANLFIMPNVDAANIAYNMVKVLGHGISIGPILLGMKQPAQILTYASDARNILNISALSSVTAQFADE